MDLSESEFIQLCIERLALLKKKLASSEIDAEDRRIFTEHVVSLKREIKEYRERTESTDT